MDEHMDWLSWEHYETHLLLSISKYYFITVRRIINDPNHLPPQLSQPVIQHELHEPNPKFTPTSVIKWELTSPVACYPYQCYYITVSLLRPF